MDWQGGMNAENMLPIGIPTYAYRDAYRDAHAIAYTYI
jgi:hypothetical protein